MADLVSGIVEDGALLKALENVAQSRLARSLIVSDGISECVLYFSIGGMRIIRSGPRRGVTVGQVLVDHGILPAGDYAQLLEIVDGDDSKALQVALEQQVITTAEYQQALREKFDEDVLDLFIWEGAEVRLMEGQPPEEFYARGNQSESLSVDVPGFISTIFGKLEAISGGTRRISTGKEIYEVVDWTLFGARDLGPFDPLKDELDGRRTLAAAIERTGLRRIPTHRLVQQLLTEGLLRRVAGVAAQKASREHFLKEAAALEDALQVSLAQHIVMGRLARALESAGETARAAAQWKALGDHFRRNNDLDRALPNYRRAARLIPSDFATRELILEIHRHKRNYKQLVSEGRPLAELFVKHNLLTRAKTLLLKLVGFDEKDVALRRLLVTVLIGTGEAGLALDHLWALAHLLEERGANEAQLRDVYLRILALDKTNKRARARLDQVTGVASQRKAVLGVVGATVVLLAGLFGAFGYEMLARGNMDEAMTEAQAYMEDGDYANARDVLKQAMARFRFSGSTGNAQKMLTWIDEIEAEMIRRQRMAESLGAIGVSTETSLAAEEMAYKASTLLEEGRLEESHRVYAELFEMYPWAEGLETAEMPLHVRVLPLDAKVYLNGEELGEGELRFRYVPRKKSKLVVEREGFQSFETILEGPQPFRLDVFLSKPVLWTFQSDAPFDASPVVSGETVFLAGRDRYLTALALRDGEPRWRSQLGLYADVAAAPVIARQGVVVATAVGDALCVTPVTGETVWRRNLSVGVTEGLVAPTPDTVVVPGTDGSLSAIASVSGEALWTAPPGTVKSGGPVGLPTGDLVFVDQTGALGLLDPASGEARASESGQDGLRGTPVLDGERLWTWASDGSLRMFSAASTAPLKRFVTPRSEGFPPVVGAKAAYVVSRDGRLTSYLPAGGAQFDPVTLPERAAATPAYSLGKLYVPGEKGSLMVLDAETGALLWRYQAAAPLTSTPVVMGGRILVTTQTGQVVALSE